MPSGVCYNKPLNKPFRSSAKNKKKSVCVEKNGKIILLHFGDSRYRHNYSAKAKKSYLARSAGIRNKSGRLTKDDKTSANYYSRRYLWDF